MKAQFKSVPVAALALFALIGCSAPDPELPKYCELPENIDQPGCDPDASFAAVVAPEHAAVSAGMSGLVRVFGMGDVNGDGAGDLAVVADTLQILDDIAAGAARPSSPRRVTLMATASRILSPPRPMVRSG